ncbi:MAG: GNAT family N-acetyltransferase [Legionella sp.]|uniref:GNAT family N-acetyltransferase n=1 Tax=Legionella sp. TaxID=459 RepID=UPI00283B3F19|nr:GNAT family N-acetyltransferase [Legionella sp.]
MATIGSKPLEIRLLKTEADWLAFQALRRSALQNTPEAFGSSYEEEIIMSTDSFKECYKKCDVFGAFMDKSLVGCVGFFIQAPIKMSHRGVLFSMYVIPTCRNKGIANLLVKTVIEHAKKSVLQVHATVVTNNQSALNLYEKHGFVIYGTEPNSLKVDNTFYDEHLMVLTLN